MIKFLVIWFVVNVSPSACPGQEPQCDEYGRCSSFMNTYAIACFDTNKTKMWREFDTIEQARKFIADAENNLCENDVVASFDGCVEEFEIQKIEEIE